MWKLGLRPRNSQKSNWDFRSSVYTLYFSIMLAYYALLCRLCMLCIYLERWHTLFSFVAHVYFVLLYCIMIAHSVLLWIPGVLCSTLQPLHALFLIETLAHYILLGTLAHSFCSATFDFSARICNPCILFSTLKRLRILCSSRCISFLLCNVCMLDASVQPLQLAYLFSFVSPVAEFIDLCQGDKVNSGLGLSYRPASHVAWVDFITKTGICGVCIRLLDTLALIQFLSKFFCHLLPLFFSILAYSTPVFF